ncbi:hypothetical protein N9043_00800 [bacterium]|nr:hypothetical protein [bacterium]
MSIVALEIKEKHQKGSRRKPNPYRSNDKRNIQHPQQSAVVLANNIIFRRTPNEVVKYFDQWMKLSEVGEIFDRIPYLHRVMAYIHSRSTVFNREGFVFRRDHASKGTSKTAKFTGSYSYFLKHLNILEEMGIIICDRRMYVTYILINYDVVGKYSMPTVHGLGDKFSDDNIEDWKHENNIYNLRDLDEKGMLETIWNHQIGFSSHYDMFSDDLFNNYSQAMESNDSFDCGDSNVNKHDQYLRDCSLQSRKDAIASGESNNQKTVSRHRQEEFIHGGHIMNVGKKAKAQMAEFNNNLYLFNPDEKSIFDVKPIVAKPKVKKDVAVKPKQIKPLDKRSADGIDWSKDDFTKIDFDKLHKNKVKSFRQAIVSQMDVWFVEGFNQRPSAKVDGAVYTHSISAKAPRAINGDWSASGKYTKLINAIFNNVYMEFSLEGVASVKAFCKWYGYRYYGLFNDISWFDVADQALVTDKINRKGVKVGWHYLASEKDTLRSMFFSQHRADKMRIAENNYQNQQPVVVSAPKGISQAEINRLKEEWKAENDLTISRVEAEKKHAESADAIKYKELMAKLVSQGYDPMALAAGELKKEEDFHLVSIPKAESKTSLPTIEEDSEEEVIDSGFDLDYDDFDLDLDHSAFGQNAPSNSKVDDSEFDNIDFGNL